MEIKPYPKNAKKHPEAQLRAIAKSLKEFGWQQPIVVDKDNVIIVGHGRYFAYIQFKDEMNLPKPEIKVAKNLSKEQVKAYRIADNKLNESDWEMDWLMEELKELPDDLFDITGFDRGFLKVGNAIDEFDDVQVDSERMNLIEVFPPETPKLTEKFYLVCDSKEDYDKILRALKKKLINSSDIVRLLKYGKTFEDIMKSFKFLGYEVRVLLLNAKNYGSAQNRERVIFLGSLEDFDYKFVEKINDSRRFRDIREKRSNFKYVNETKRVKNKINGYLDFKFQLVGGYDIVGTLTTQQGCGEKLVQEKNGKWRLLTLLECERLQGFSDNWTEGESDTNRYFALAK